MGLKKMVPHSECTTFPKVYHKIALEWEQRETIEQGTI